MKFLCTALLLLLVWGGWPSAIASEEPSEIEIYAIKPGEAVWFFEGTSLVSTTNDFAIRFQVPEGKRGLRT
jgi:hypothetical protein